MDDTEKMVSQYCERVLSLCAVKGINIESQQQVKWLYLLFRMDQCVKESGFPHFLKSLNGNYLSDVEDALIAINAKGAQDAYVSCVEAALFDKDGYQQYLADGPNPGTHFYDQAMAATLEYLTRGISIFDAQPSAIAKLFPYIDTWLDENSA